MKPSFYWDSKAEFSQIYDLYFAKALIHGFTMDMSLSFYWALKQYSARYMTFTLLKL